jgi:signal transduction histidine kinase
MARFLEGHPSARWRLTLLALVLPLVVVSAVFIWQDYQSRRDAITTQVRLKSALVNAQLEDFVHTVRGASGVFADGWVQKHTPASTDLTEMDLQISYLENFVADRPHFSGAYITDAIGTVTASSDRSILGQRVGPSSLYEQAYSTGGFTVSDVIAPDADQPPFALFVQPLTWNGGNPGGFLVLRSDLATISGTLDMSVGFPTTAKSGIFDSKGTILAGTGYEAPHPGLAVGRDISGSFLWSQASTYPTEEWFGPGLDNVDRIIFFGYPDTTPWISTVAYAQSEIFDPLWDRLWIFGGALAVTSMAILWLGEILIGRERRGVVALEKERLTLDAVMNGASDGIMVMDVNNRINFANQRIIGMLGARQWSLVTQPFRVVKDFIVSKSDDQALAANQLDHAMLSEGGVVADSLSMKNSLGLELEMTSYPLLNENGDPLGRTLVFRDVTQEKAIQRMKSQFLSTASHQLRTPMASILAFSELSLTRQATPPKKREWLEQIHSQSTRMTGIINSMLNVSQMESGRLDLHLQEFDAGKVCREITDEFKAKSGIHYFALNIPAPLARIRADQGKFTQIIENLVDNAIKYSPESGRITIAAEVQHDGKIRFRVTDSGVGISLEAQKDLFIPFSRIPNDKTGHVSGTGLGLYIARNLVELHDGKMWIESRPDYGTTIYFTMPGPNSMEPADSGAVRTDGFLAPAFGSA